MVFFYGQIDDLSSKHWRGMDFPKYRAIAQAAPRLATNVPRPFAYRLLGPYFAGLLPLPDPVAFHLLAVLASASVVAILYFFICHLGASPPIAALTAGLFMCNKFFFGFPLWDSFQVNDALSLAYLVVLFWAVQERRWAVFAAVMVLGAFTRETVLLIVPAALVQLWERGELGAQWKRLALALAPAVACFVLIRHFVPASGGQGLVSSFLTYVRKLGSPAELGLTLLKPFAPLLFLPVVCYGTTLRFFRARRHAALFFVLVFMSTLFGTDRERLMAPAAVVFYPLVALIIEEHFRGSRWVLAALVLGCMASSFSAWIGRFHLPNETVTAALTIGATLLITAVALLQVIALRRSAG
jgi:hypothetical protein